MAGDNCLMKGVKYHIDALFPARKHKHRRKKHPYRAKLARIKGRNGLHLRPAAANERSEFGHWESDSVVGADRIHGLNTLVERKCRMSHISLMTQKTADQTDKIIVRRLKKYPQRYRKSITYDNGSENTLHLLTNEKLDTQSYFCEPYHSWEKGSVEQINGLIRRFLPKGTCFKNISTSEINKIEKLLNNRPRKCLKFKTPYEVFREHRGALSR